MPLTAFGETEPYDPMDWEFEEPEPWTGPRCAICRLPILDGVYRLCSLCEAYDRAVQAGRTLPRLEPLSTDFDSVPF